MGQGKRSGTPCLGATPPLPLLITDYAYLLRGSTDEMMEVPLYYITPRSARYPALSKQLNVEFERIA